MVKHNFRQDHDPQFFPEKNGAESRGAPADRFALSAKSAANTNERESHLAADESAVWANYNPSGSAMFDTPNVDAKNVHSSSRWLVRSAVAAFFIVGVGIAVATYQGRSPAEPTAIEDASSAAAVPAAMAPIQNPREADASAALSGGATAKEQPASEMPAQYEPAPAAKASAAKAPLTKSEVAKPAPKAADPANAAAAPAYGKAAPTAVAPNTMPTSPANPTSALPPIMPNASTSGATAPAPSDPTTPPAAQLTPAPTPGSTD